MEIKPLRIGFLGVVLGLCLLSEGCGRKQEFVSKEGGFAVETAGIVTQKKQTANNQEGFVDIYTLTFAWKDPEAQYWVVYIDYPELTIRKRGGQGILGDARDGSLANVGGSLLAEKKVFLKEYPGLEIDYRGQPEDPNLYRSRIFLVNRRVFVVLVTSPQEGKFSSRAQAFLDSFRLL